MARRLHYLIFVSVVFCLPVIFLLSRVIVRNITTMEEVHVWRNLNGLSMMRANELFMNCCQAILLPQSCLKLCKYDIDVSAVWSLKDVQDKKLCNIIENFEFLLKCANGMHKQHDLRPCCLKYGAITSKFQEEDSCSQFCHPHQTDEFLFRPETIFCISKMKAISYCHFTNLEDEN